MSNETSVLSARALHLLERYVEIQAEAFRLEQERKALRDELAGEMRSKKTSILPLAVNGRPTVVRCFSKIVYDYDEETLKNRLAERYPSILDPDVKKMKAILPQLRDLLVPALDQIGTPSRNRIRDEIQSGRLDATLFSGAFSRRIETSFSVAHAKISPDGE